MDMKQMIKMDDAAKAFGNTIGRFIAVPYNYEGWAFYQVRGLEFKAGNVVGYKMEHQSMRDIPDVRMPDLDEQGWMDIKSVKHYVAFNRGWVNEFAEFL